MLDRVALARTSQTDIIQMAHRATTRRFDPADGLYEDWGFVACLVLERDAGCFARAKQRIQERLA